ncbi:rho GTPase-activating protein 11A isoform X2 [Hyperolius riggenbachi]|uniref:rho GTPase-activating protein 11A isoform X2 n=1 Tax=Hyperolius riggenbachi TaxID=752182 RepID=UPI0035A2D941
MKHTPDYQSLARLAVIQHLRSYGIKVKHWNCKQRSDPGKGSSGALHSGKIFGTSIHTLPLAYIPEYGNIPVFLADVCKYLEDHANTEGLFRKSGSVARQKLLKTKLDKGDSGLSDFPPCDVAGILKQFFRELPEAILPAELQDAMVKAQQLASDEDKTSATILISCLMPERTTCILRYFFNFLHVVSKRSDTNKMDSSNLSVIFAPNLLQSDDNEKISAATERKLRVQAAIVRTLIDQAADIGCVPEFLLEKIPGMLGVDGSSNTPGAEASEEGDGDSPGEKKRRRRRSVGVFNSMVTPLILTPSTKRKLPLDSVQGISNKKRKSIKQNLAFELLPSSLFGGGSTPSSARTEGSPYTSFEVSENSFSPSVSNSKHLTSSSNLRRSKRHEIRKVQRVESGKTGCFSPKISRKEMVRRSLRLRFSLGKSCKEVNAGNSTSNRSETIGWRLANSQELPVLGNQTESSPGESQFVSSGSKKISKSEDNLLTPKTPSDDSNHRMSWTGPHQLTKVFDEGTPLSGFLYAGNCFSEPILVTGKPPVMPQEMKPLATSCGKAKSQKEDSLCEVEQWQAQDTVRRITQAFTESGSGLSVVVGSQNPSEHGSPPLLSDPQISSKTLVTESEKSHNDDQETRTSKPQVHSEVAVYKSDNRCQDGNPSKQVACDKYLKEMTPAGTPAKSLQTIQCTESPQIVLKIVEDANTDFAEEIEISPHNQKCNIVIPYFQADSSSVTKSVCSVFEVTDMSAASEPSSGKTVEAAAVSSHSPPTPIRRSSRVSDHIQHFNRLCLNDHGVGQKVKSPIKLQRTPVRQSVRRINSLLQVSRQEKNPREIVAGSPLVKSVSCDGSLCLDGKLTHSKQKLFSAGSQENAVFCESLATPSLRATRSKFSRQSLGNTPSSVPSSLHQGKSVLEDLTNQDVSRPICTKPELCSSAPNKALRILSGREHNRYRGSPKNPIGKVAFLPASKPLDL